VRALFEERLAFELLTLFEHVFSWRPAKLPGFAQMRAGSVTRASRGSRELTGVWRGACAVGGARRLCWDRVIRSNTNTTAFEVARQ